MENETLQGKVSRTTDEEKELIAQILGASGYFKQSLSEALVDVKKDKALTVLKAFAKAKKKSAFNQFSRWILDVIPTKSFPIPISINRIKSAPLEAINEILTSQDTLQKLSISDPLTVYRLKGIQAKWDLLFDDDLPLDSTEVAALLNVTRQKVNQWRKQGRLLGIDLGNIGYLYPAWQFQQNNVIKGLERVLKELQEYDSWTQLLFLKTGDIRLKGATPLEKLRSGDIDTVIWAASCYGKHISA